MARYNTPVKDWTVRYRHGKYKFGERTLQQGVTQFSRKKKNACKLASTPQIKASIAKTVERDKNTLTCKLAFPKINLKDPKATPRVVVVVKKPILDPKDSRFGRSMGGLAIG